MLLVRDIRLPLAEGEQEAVAAAPEKKRPAISFESRSLQLVYR